MSLDLSLYVITTCVPALGRSHEDVARAALAGGASVIQFRDKSMDDAAFMEAALAVAKVARQAGAPVIVNDRLEIALEIGAEGVHLGVNDGDIAAARKRIPGGMILGASATTYEEALDMYQAGADYLGVGPVFPTASKSDAARAMGTGELARICRAVKIPVVAIGGINRESIRQVIDAGACGVAVISAIANAEDMTEAATKLRLAWRR